MLTIGHLMTALTGFSVVEGSRPIASVVIDSRQASPDSLFVALRGARHDGHDFVAEAFARGAVAAFVERPLPGLALLDCRQPSAWQPVETLPVQLWVNDSLAALQQIARYWRQQRSVRVIGITGSVGKTTTKELTAAVLAQRYRTLKSEGNYNNEIGLPLTLLGLRPEHERVVLEMGMYVPGDLRLLADIARPQVGVLTLVGTVHLERAGTLEALIAGKRELVEALPPDGVAVLNFDEPIVMGMAPYTQARVFTYGLNPAADLWADEIESLAWHGVRMRLHSGGESVRVQMPLLGRHSVQTALRAAAVGLIEGMDWNGIVAGLHQHRDTLRLQVVEGPQGTLILDDTYNASPESMLAALNLLRDLSGRRVAVLGDMLELGSAEIDGHRTVGQRAAAVADVLIAVGSRARHLGQAALDSGLQSNQVYFTEDAAAATPLLRDLIRPGDVILVKGSRSARLDAIVTALTRATQQSQPA